jgi:Ni/Fe-hydrogenase subunit HybB-like protein
MRSSLSHGISFCSLTSVNGALLIVAQIGYGAILAIMLHLGGAWLARTGRSQEMFDSTVIMVWVCLASYLWLQTDE